MELADQLADALRRANQGPYKERRPPGAWSPEACAVYRAAGPDLKPIFYAALCFELTVRRHAKPSDLPRIQARARAIAENTARVLAERESGNA